MSLLTSVATDDMTKPLQVRCPTCKQRGDWFTSEFGPFCSKRCRLVDLGKWFSQEHAISEPLKPGHFAEFAELPDNTDLDQPDDKQ